MRLKSSVSIVVAILMVLTVAALAAPRIQAADTYGVPAVFQTAVSVTSCNATGVSLSYMVNKEGPEPVSVTMEFYAYTNGSPSWSQPGVENVPQAPAPAAWTYTMNAAAGTSYNWEVLWITVYGGEPTFESRVTGHCTWLGEGYLGGVDSLVNEVPSTTPAPGCDTTMAITSSSVVGRFVADANLYYAVGKLTNPLATIPAGESAWVLGQDASGEYYKIVWVCGYYWVKVGTLGPNPDAVWNNTPLPATVVE